MGPRALGILLLLAIPLVFWAPADTRGELAHAADLYLAGLHQEARDLLEAQADLIRDAGLPPESLALLPEPAPPVDAALLHAREESLSRLLDQHARDEPAKALFRASFYHYHQQHAKAREQANRLRDLKPGPATTRIHSAITAHH